MSDPVAASAAPFNMPALSAGFDARGAFVLLRLAADLGLTQAQAAGIVGNLGGESGLKAIQEIAPIAGRGGFGWAQWTGSRRTAFEHWCADHSLDQISDEANYGYLLVELRGEQAHALEQVKKTATVEAAVYTFEVYFERPADVDGTLPSRIAFAKRALAAAVGLAAPDPDHSADELNRQELAQLSAPAPAAQPVADPAPPAVSPGTSVAIGSGAAAVLTKNLMFLSACIAAGHLLPLDETTAGAMAAGSLMLGGWYAHRKSRA